MKKKFLQYLKKIDYEEVVLYKGKKARLFNDYSDKALVDKINKMIEVQNKIIEALNTHLSQEEKQV